MVLALMLVMALPAIAAIPIIQILNPMDNPYPPQPYPPSAEQIEAMHKPDTLKNRPAQRERHMQRLERHKEREMQKGDIPKDEALPDSLRQQ